MNDNKMPKLRELTVEDQDKSSLYHIVMKFKADLALLVPGADLSMFPDMSLSAGNAVVFTIDQVVNFIPDDETLGKYAGILQDGYAEAGRKSGFEVRNVRFSHYESVKAVRALYGAAVPGIEQAPQAPFTAHISWDGNYLTVDDGSDQVSQECISPERARSIAMARLREIMEDADEE